MSRFYPFIFLGFIGLGNPFLAQDYLSDVQHYGVEDGLSHREIFDIHQDKQGFTKYGLDHFDGRTFKWWTKEKNGLANNEINHLLEDANGWLWLFTGGWFHPSRPTQLSMVDTHCSHK